MLTIGERELTLTDFQRIVSGNERIAIASKARERVKKSYKFLESFPKDKIIYGINTGLGPIARYRIDEEDSVKYLEIKEIKDYLCTRIIDVLA
jgi:histidine ammonia-lyase